MGFERGLLLNRVRGQYHQKLLAFLQARWKAHAFTQDSLGRELGKDQTSMGKYLKDTAGTLDLDEADAALTHAGSSLRMFIADPVNVVVRPAVQLSPSAAKLWLLLREMKEPELQIFLGLARSARRLALQKEGQSARRRAVDRLGTKRKIGEKR